MTLHTDTLTTKPPKTSESAIRLLENFTEDSQLSPNPSACRRSNCRQHNLEVRAMFHTKKARSPYTRALWGAALAAVLCACTQKSATTAGSTPTVTSTAPSSELPEVVVTAPRKQPSPRG